MNVCCQKLFRTVKNRDGFTLIEMLIVIIILGILAMVIIPQISVSTDDAKVSTLKTNLAGIRSAIEVYYAQHKMTYPGVNKTDGTAAGAADVVAAFTAQMTQFSDDTGKTSPTQVVEGVTYPFGPYIKGGVLPANPFKDNLVTVTATDFAQATITADRATAADGASGWKYWPKLGVIFANDNTSSGDIAHTTY